MKYELIVYGHPVPYTRTTYKAKFVSKQYRRYDTYKKRIQTAFFASLDEEWSGTHALIMRQNRKPIIAGKKTYVWVKAMFKNRRHGDMDNIYKGVLDALFVDDKLCVGAFDYDYDKENPRLEIMITTRLETFKDRLNSEYTVRR